MDEYGRARDFNDLNIQVTSKPTSQILGGGWAMLNGDGADTIQGSAGDDIIRVHDFQGANTVEAIDGGGGVDIIAGTDLADTIDLSATTVTGIARIEGGAGADTIKGTSGNDVLYGGSQDNPEDEARDLLAGGAGADEYHIGIGDIIDDPDNQGTIWFDGVQLSSLVFKQQSEDGDYYETADNTWRGVINDGGSDILYGGGDNDNLLGNKAENLIMTASIMARTIWMAVPVTTVCEAEAQMLFFFAAGDYIRRKAA